MLERGAAGIESCGLHRVLPHARTPVRSSRRLHTAFFKHGAADIELSPAWQELVRAPLNPLDLLNSAPARAELMNASVVMLDFLYPKGALTYLRGLSPSFLDRNERARSQAPNPSSRTFTSSSRRQSPPPTETRATEQEIAGEDSVAVDQDVHIESHVAQAEEAPRGLSEAADSPTATDVPIAGQETEPKKKLTMDLEFLRKFLDKSNPEERGVGRFDEVWELYLNQAPEVQAQLRMEMFKYLQYCRGVGEAWRVSALCSVLEGEWDFWTARTAIQAELTLDNYPRALAIFEHCLAQDAARGAGVGFLLAHALERSDWSQLEGISASYHKALPGQTFHSNDLVPLRTLKNLGEKLNSLFQHICAEVPQGFSESRASQIEELDRQPELRSLLTILVTAGMNELDPAFARELVHWSADPLAYEEFIRLCTEQWGLKDLAIEAYQIYRTLPDVEVRGFILRMMIYNVYIPNNDAPGVEQCLKDMYRRYGKLNAGTYRTVLKFYADRGDATSAYRLWNEYTGHFPETIQDGSAFVNLMNLHVTRREPSEVKRIWKEMKEIYRVPRSKIHHNIFLMCLFQSGQYIKANDHFLEMRRIGQTDSWSFGTIMTATGRRGDLDWTTQLYNWARQEKVPMTVTMVNGLVEALCRSGRFAEAESLCHTVNRRKTVQGSQTPLWNTILQQHAMRRDLTNVNRVLSSMTTLGIPYDDQSYDALLQGLLLCRQAHHAMHLLRVAVQDKIFTPTQNHYTLLMAAFLRTGELHHVLALNRQMREIGFKRATDEHLTILMRALAKWKLFPDEERVDRLGRILRMFLRQLNLKRSDSKFTISREKTFFGGAASLFAEFRDYVTVRELVRLFHELVQESDQELGVKRRQPAQTLSRQLLLQVLAAQVHDKEYQAAHETWEYIFETTLAGGHNFVPSPEEHDGYSAEEEGEDDSAYESASSAEESDSPSQSDSSSTAEDSPAADSSSTAPQPTPSQLPTPSTTRQISPGLRYSLCDAFLTMQTLYEETSDAPALLAQASRLTSHGFRLDSKNLNMQVQILARLKHWQEAFAVCEEQLIAQWMGWNRVRARLPVRTALPLETRRLGTHREFNRPTSYTLATLAKEYFDLVQMAPWSRDAERLLGEMNERFPRCVSAVRTMVRTHSSSMEREVLGRS